MQRKRKESVPPWHPRILVPAIMFGLPFCYTIRLVSRNVPKKWRSLPGKLPHVSSTKQGYNASTLCDASCFCVHGMMMTFTTPLTFLSAPGNF